MSDYNIRMMIRDNSDILALGITKKSMLDKIRYPHNIMIHHDQLTEYDVLWNIANGYIDTRVVKVLICGGLLPFYCVMDPAYSHRIHLFIDADIGLRDWMLEVCACKNILIGFKHGDQDWEVQ